MFFLRSRRNQPLQAPLVLEEQRLAAEPRNLEAGVISLFTPASPIAKEQLFAGRQDAIRQLVEATLERSRHAVLYGERGVGKTSLANMFWQRHALVRATVAVRIQADPSDDFSSLWRKALRELADRSGIVHNPHVNAGDAALSPDDVRRQLGASCRGSAIVIIDEFDRFANPGDSVLMANLLKNLSDYSVNCTVIIVGVAETASELVSDHASLRRSLAWVPLHRMKDEEINELLGTRLERLQITAAPDAMERIVVVSRGLPFYVHSIAKGACLRVAREGGRHITAAHVEDAILTLGDDLRPSFLDDYLGAVSGIGETLYPQVLLASALARSDPEGYFTAGAVAAPLSRLLSRPIEAMAFRRHLAGLTSEERGRILIRRGQAGEFRYRFRDSLIHPYIIINGIREGLVDPNTAFTPPGFLPPFDQPRQVSRQAEALMPQATPFDVHLDLGESGDRWSGAWQVQ